MKFFALAGNPNCGKTTLFNSLTGSTAHVGNWPGVTVDKKEGVYKKGSEPVSIVDLPGIYSLSPYTPEEVISRNYILDEKPDCVINIVDATNLERNLYLSTQIMEIDVPMVIALNMMDVLKKEGSSIDVKYLEDKMGIPVVEISALKEENLDKLMEVAIEASKKKRKGKTILEGSMLVHLIHDVEIAFKGINVENPLFHAIKLVENDEIEVKNHKSLVQVVDEFKATFKDDVFGTDFEAVVADSRYKYISKYFAPSLKKVETHDKSKTTKSDKIDKVLTNKWAGIPIFLLILLAIFHLTFSENFLFFGSFFNNVEASFSGTPFEGLLWTSDGINSPGVILFNLLDCVTAFISDSVANLIASIEGTPAWVSGLICDGILGGVFAVLSFLPQILFLFLFFSILEDSGYMARVAFILDRIFRKFGLSGRAFMPMIMGFGCSVPAMINTRTLADDDERCATIRVIPFFSCGAKLPILTAIAGGIVLQLGVGNADLITFSMYLLGMCTAIVAIILMRNTIMRGEVPPFIMELPAYHAPQFKALMLHLWDKVKHFVKKAFTIIFASTIVIWFLQSFTFDWQFIEPLVVTDEMTLEEFTMIVSDPNRLTTGDSILAGFGKLLQPLFIPLGFGIGEWAWVFVVAAFTGLIAKENVISTFAILAACIVTSGGLLDTSSPQAIQTAFETLKEVSADEDGIAAVSQMIIANGINSPAPLISFIAFNMTTIPCFAAVSTAKAELPNGRFKGTILFWVIVSYVVSMIVYFGILKPWTILITIGLAVLLGVFIHYFNKRNDMKKAR